MTGERMSRRDRAAMVLALERLRMGCAEVLFAHGFAADDVTQAVRVLGHGAGPGTNSTAIIRGIISTLDPDPITGTNRRPIADGSDGRLLRARLALLLRCLLRVDGALEYGNIADRVLPMGPWKCAGCDVPFPARFLTKDGPTVSRCYYGVGQQAALMRTAATQLPEAAGRSMRAADVARGLEHLIDALATTTEAHGAGVNVDVLKLGDALRASLGDAITDVDGAFFYCTCCRGDVKMFHHRDKKDVVHHKDDCPLVAWDRARSK